MIPASQRLRRAVAKSPLPVKTIAARSRVGYLPLWRWLRGINGRLDLDEGERVLIYLTGKGIGR